MSEEEFTRLIQVIRQQIEELDGYTKLPPTQRSEFLSEAIANIVSSIDNFQLLQEQMQASLEVMEIIQEELLEQNEYLAKQRERYCELFEFAPDAYLLISPQGIILEANGAAAGLFNVLQNFLIGKPLVTFVAETERSVFHTKLKQLCELYSSTQEWEILMCSRAAQPFDASLSVAPVRDSRGSLVYLRVTIRDVTKYKQANLQQRPAAATVEVPHSLDGLQVLFVDDQIDAREFITLVLEQQGISVTAVTSVSEALEALEQTRPDVIISDIRMPDEDGYALIRKIKALEAEKGWQIPTAALTAYPSENSAQAIQYKLVFIRTCINLLRQRS